MRKALRWGESRDGRDQRLASDSPVAARAQQIGTGECEQLGRNAERCNLGFAAPCIVRFLTRVRLGPATGLAQTDSATRAAETPPVSCSTASRWP